jgi:hypothetical protein
MNIFNWLFLAFASSSPFPPLVHNQFLTIKLIYMILIAGQFGCAAAFLIATFWALNSSDVHYQVNPFRPPQKKIM